jgi:AraC-like DNA-binding protein
MIRKKSGFRGERSVILPQRVVETEEQDPLVGSLYITDIGHYPMAEHHHRIRTEAIDQYVLIYCVDGNGFYTLKGKTYQVKRNQYFILPAGLPHEYGAADGDRWTIYWVHFRGEHAAVYAEGAQQPQDVRVALNSNILNRNNIFEEILATLHYGDHLEDLRYASSLLHYYLASLRYLRQYRREVKEEGRGRRVEGGGQKVEGVVDAAIHYMKESIERHISLQDVLDYVGYSSTRFSVLFKQQTGSSPLAYFNRIKVEHACQLLKQTDLHINQISYKVGIDDSLYFSRLFSKAVGMSPSAYRRRVRVQGEDCLYK